MPLHYALTDALVMLVAAWGVWRMVQSRQPIAALGIALFGMAGAIGTVRITAGLDEQLAGIHKMTSQLGGVAGTALLLSQILRHQNHAHSTAVSLFAALAAMAVAALFPAAGAALFIAMLVGAIALLLRARAYLGAAVFTLMLINVLLIRQSARLGPDVSWHAYHVIVAIWLACTAAYLAKPASTT